MVFGVLSPPSGGYVFQKLRDERETHAAPAVAAGPQAQPHGPSSLHLGLWTPDALVPSPTWRWVALPELDASDEEKHACVAALLSDEMMATHFHQPAAAARLIDYFHAFDIDINDDPMLVEPFLKDFLHCMAPEGVEDGSITAFCDRIVLEDEFSGLQHGLVKGTTVVLRDLIRLCCGVVLSEQAAHRLRCFMHVYGIDRNNSAAITQFFPGWWECCGPSTLDPTALARLRCQFASRDLGNGKFPLGWAIDLGEHEVAAELIEFGPVIPSGVAYSTALTDLIVDETAPLSLIASMIGLAPRWISVPDEDGNLPLSMAAYRSVEICQLLIDNKVDINRAEGDGLRPIHHAINLGYADVVSLLRSYHAVLLIGETENWPLEGAVSIGDVAVLKAAFKYEVASKWVNRLKEFVRFAPPDKQDELRAILEGWK